MSEPGVREKPPVSLPPIDEALRNLSLEPTRETLYNVAKKIIESVNGTEQEEGKVLIGYMAAFLSGSVTVLGGEVALLEADETEGVSPHFGNNPMDVGAEIERRKEHMETEGVTVSWFDQLSGVGPNGLQIKRKGRESCILRTLDSLNEAVKRGGQDDSNPLVLSPEGERVIMSLFPKQVRWRRSR